jgi:hypothetical protein
MSFRLFIYYCALLGGWAGLGGWALGRMAAPAEGMLRTGVRGMWLGLAVAFGVGLIDAAQSVGWRRIGAVLLRLLTAMLIGAVGGFLGGLLGAALQEIHGFLFFIGWTVTGLLVGVSIAFFDFLSALIARKNMSGAMGKLIKCIIGGGVGGLLGGLLASAFNSIFYSMFGTGRSLEAFWTPTAAGFIAVGVMVGLLVGLAQVILKEAWIKVEAGFRPGREMILAKDRISIGRAEGMDIALFGDQGVEKTHAFIVVDAGRYYVEDAGTPTGTFVNDQRVSGRTALKSEDMIKLGTKSMLRFFEKQKRRD